MASARETREAIERERRDGPARRPERKLEVLWQRHVPAGLSVTDNDAFVDAYADLIPEIEKQLDELDTAGRFADADLVITISRRPL